jgi:hypothetical protein
LALKDLYRLLKREIETSSLQKIEPDTFQKIAASLGSLKGQGFEGVEARNERPACRAPCKFRATLD